MFHIDNFGITICIGNEQVKRLVNIRRIFFFLLAFNISQLGEIVGQNWDIRLLREINLNRNTSFDPAFRVVSNSVAPLCVVTPLIIFSVGHLTMDSLLKQNAIYSGATLITSVIVSNILKYGINRTRPFDEHPEIEKATSVHSPSFPSGHTSNAFALATSLSLSYPKWYVILPSFTWAATVAYVRMDLGVHYPSDVLIGTLIGVGSAYLCYKLNQRLKQK
jgi:membrane-associated phospholipid phosphatase